MKNIEKYIQFAIDNWLLNNRTDAFSTYWCKIWEWDFTISFGKKWVQEFIEIKSFHFTELITSKEFLEAVARGLLKTKKWNYVYFKNWFEILIEDKKDKWIEILSNRITKEQAIAIRDNTLDDFITNLLWKQ